MWYFSHKHRLAYLNVPKSACTTIRFLLMAAERPDEIRRALAEAKRPERAAWQFQYDHRDALTPSGPFPDECRGYLRFTFVRQPTKRIVSAYLNKILMWKDDEGKKHNHDPELFKRQYAPGGFRPQMSLDEFIERLHKAPNRVVNGHFRPQTTFVLSNKRLQADFIGRLESLKDHLKLIIPEDIHDLIDIKLNVTPPPPDLTVSRKSHARLLKYVRGDARFFGYEADELPRYVTVE